MLFVLALLAGVGACFGGLTDVSSIDPNQIGIHRFLIQMIIRRSHF